MTEPGKPKRKVLSLRSKDHKHNAGSRSLEGKDDVPTAKVEIATSEFEENVKDDSPYGKYTFAINSILSGAELLTPSDCLTVLTAYPESEYLRRAAAEGRAFLACDWQGEAFRNLDNLARKATDVASMRCHDNNIKVLMTDRLRTACIVILAGDKISESDRALLLKGWNWIFGEIQGLHGYGNFDHYKK